MSKKIIFQHIPKTAGTSLTSLFVDQFDRNLIFICGSQDGVLKDFLKLKKNEKNQLQLLIGHVDYGIHKNFKVDSKYITFLRDPIERVLSHYWFIRSNKFHRYHEWARKMDIGEFIQSAVRPKMNNCMVRMISGKNPDYNECYDEMVDIALENLHQNYIFVGFISQLSKSVEALTKKMGWDEVEIQPKNVNKNKPDIQSIPKSSIDIIHQYNLLDIKFYNIACKRFLSESSHPIF